MNEPRNKPAKKPTPVSKKEFSELRSTVSELVESVNGIVDIIQSKQVPGVIVKEAGTMEVMDEDFGKAEPAHFKRADGTGQEEPTLIQPAPEQDLDGKKEKWANEQFMQEMVTVYVHDTSERNADPVFSISVNGHEEIFVRGQKKTVKRYIVEGLARAKPVTFKNEEYTTPDGIRAVRWPQARGPRYGFEIVEDRNPRGKAWLQSVLAQP